MTFLEFFTTVPLKDYGGHGSDILDIRLSRVLMRVFDLYDSKITYDIDRLKHNALLMLST